MINKVFLSLFSFSSTEDLMILYNAERKLLQMLSEIVGTESPPDIFFIEEIVKLQRYIFC
jgi:hypothetical protein